MSKILTNMPKRMLQIGAWILVLGILVLTFETVVASAFAGRVIAAAQISPIHPSFPLLDSDGENVLDSGDPVSTMETCGACHDTAFIASHSFHTDVGFNSWYGADQAPTGRSWDASPGWFGKWDPVGYRYLSRSEDDRLDLSTAGWIQTLGLRHAGGGPAETSLEGLPLTEVQPSNGDPEASILDPKTGQALPWDWQESGVVEMNCFLCHIPQPNNEARIEALETGEFAWANTATLLGTGLVERRGDDFIWQDQAFTPEGELKEDRILIQDPTDDNCGLCHGLVYDDLEVPLAISGCVPERYRTVTTGQIISPQRLADSGMNLADKASLTRSWDVHAERLVSCTDCHFSLNNPVYDQPSEDTQPEHLEFDPRRLEIGEYLYQPLHQFARGESAHSDLAPELKDTMRRCDSCHSIEATHDWLPYKERHVQELSCETCHIPQIYTNAMRQNDWTVLTLEGNPSRECRGVEGDVNSFNALITGFEPVLLSRADVEGNTQLAPFNLITSWFWVYGDPPKPVRLFDLRTAYFDDEGYHPNVLGRFDADGDGEISKAELRIDTPEKEELIASRLAELGIPDARIHGDIQAFSINHTIASDEWAVRDCQVCHSDQSQFDQPFQLASYIPGGVMPVPVEQGSISLNGELEVQPDGALYYLPVIPQTDQYVFGRDSVEWVDRLGGFLFLATLLGVVAHATLRLVTALRGKPAHPSVQRVYMYSVYERLWHWLQTGAIVLLLFTGLIIHAPDTFGIFSFSNVVIVHNVLAAILAANAALALFYHLASGEIQQYLPRPAGFFDQAIVQAMFYVRGIFSGEPHPFEKTPERKLNPLQQMTYFAILNVLLPLIGLTGILMWGMQRWPTVAAIGGGLPFLAPIHTLIAWLFASFIVLHVYLTTTGPTPTANLRAMIMGWDEVEIQPMAGELE